LARDTVGLTQAPRIAPVPSSLTQEARRSTAAAVSPPTTANALAAREQSHFDHAAELVPPEFQQGPMHLYPEPPIDLEAVKKEIDAAMTHRGTLAADGRPRVLSYDAARYFIFSKLDNRDGVVSCVYTGRDVRTHDIPDGRDMNTEHTWPQSKGAKGAAKSDMHHLFPTDSEANSRRGSYPFGKVVGDPIWQNAGSKLGRDEHGHTVFEPRDVHKGNVARALFYFSQMYNIEIPDDEERWLREWDKADPVDAAERVREAAITEVQGVGNRFVTDPAAADSVQNF